MGILADVIALKAQERQADQDNIAQIGQSVQNFIQLRRQTEQDELKRRNVESQIEARKPNPLELSVQRAESITALREAGDPQSLNTVASMLGQRQGSIAGEIAGTTTSDQTPLAEPIGKIPADEKSPTVEFTQATEEDVTRQLDSGTIDLRTQAGQTDPVTGKATPQAEEAEFQLKLSEKESESGVAGDAAVALQQLKASDKAKQNLEGTDLKIGITLDEFILFAAEQKDLFGVDPGPLSGTLANFFGSVSKEFRNKFFNSFQGSTIEYAAAVGRNAMPGTRAARIIDLFRQTAPTEFDTIESGMRNAALSWGQAISTDFNQGTPEVKDQYIPGYSKMDPAEKTKARFDIMKPYIKGQIDFFETEYLKRAYKANPDILKPKTQKEIEKLLREDIRTKLRSN